MHSHPQTCDVDPSIPSPLPTETNPSPLNTNTPSVGSISPDDCTAPASVTKPTQQETAQNVHPEFVTEDPDVVTNDDTYHHILLKRTRVLKVYAEYAEFSTTVEDPSVSATSHIPHTETTNTVNTGNVAATSSSSITPTPTQDKDWSKLTGDDVSLRFGPVLTESTYYGSHNSIRYTPRVHSMEADLSPLNPSELRHSNYWSATKPGGRLDPNRGKKNTYPRSLTILSLRT